MAEFKVMVVDRSKSPEVLIDGMRPDDYERVRSLLAEAQPADAPGDMSAEMTVLWGRTWARALTDDEVRLLDQYLGARW